MCIYVCERKRIDRTVVEDEIRPTLQARSDVSNQINYKNCAMNINVSFSLHLKGQSTKRQDDCQDATWLPSLGGSKSL